jgi:hypothetical protein
MIFVTEWPNEEFVSFIDYILLTKSLPCKYAVETGMPLLFRVFRIFRDYFTTMEMPLYDKYRCHKHQEGNLQTLKRFCVVHNSVKVRSLVDRLDSRVEAFRRPSVFEKILNSSA